MVVINRMELCRLTVRTSFSFILSDVINACNCLSRSHVCKGRSRNHVSNGIDVRNSSVAETVNADLAPVCGYAHVLQAKVIRIWSHAHSAEDSFHLDLLLSLLALNGNGNVFRVRRLLVYFHSAHLGAHHNLHALLAERTAKLSGNVIVLQRNYAVQELYQMNLATHCMIEICKLASYGSGTDDSQRLRQSLRYKCVPV